MTRLLVLGALALAMPALALPTSQQRVVQLNERANGTTVRVHVGDTIRLTLAANASTGYAWAFTSSGRPVLRVDAVHVYPPPKQPGPPLLGASGTFVAGLSVLKPGRCTIVLVYRRHTSPPAPPAKRFSATIAART